MYRDVHREESDNITLTTLQALHVSLYSVRNILLLTY